MALVGNLSANFSNEFNATNKAHVETFEERFTRELYGRHEEMLFWAIAMGCVSFFGAITNMLVLVAAWPQKAKKSSFGILICHFIAIHFVFCFINIPTYVFMVRARIDGRYMPPHICNYIQSMVTICAGLINWSDAGMAMNRTVALFFPLHYKAWTTKFSNVCVLGFGWIMTLAGWGSLVFAPTIGFDAVIRMADLGECSFSPQAAGPAGKFAMAALTFAPYSITGLGAVLILIKSTRISRHARLVHNQPGHQDAPSKALQYRLKMARMLLFTFLWTAMCSTPGYLAVYFFVQVLRASPVSALWFRISQPFQYGFTPCILLMSNDEYRKRLKALIHRGAERMLSAVHSNTAHTGVPDVHSNQGHGQQQLVMRPVA